MAIFDQKYSDSFYLLTESEEKLYPFQQKNRKTNLVNFRVGRESSHNSLTHKDPAKRALELNEAEMFNYVINQKAFARFYISKDSGVQSNYRSIHSDSIKAVVIHPDWLHLKNKMQISLHDNSHVVIHRLSLVRKDRDLFINNI